MSSDDKLVVRTVKKSFGTIIQEYRQRNGWTQEELASRAGLTREQVSRIERDRCTPSVATVEQLENALNLPPMSLVRAKMNPEMQLFSDSEEEKCVGYACKKLEFALVTNLTKTDMLKASDAISTISELINHSKRGSKSK